MTKVSEVLKRHVEHLMGLPGVFGVSVGEDEEGECIDVQVEVLTRELREKIPSDLDGVRVRVREMGQPEAF